MQKGKKKKKPIIFGQKFNRNSKLNHDISNFWKIYKFLSKYSNKVF